MMPRNRWVCPAVVALAIGVMLTRIILTYPIFNDTADEPYHIGAAVSMWEAGRPIRGIQHPPLTRIVAGLPLVLSGVRLPADRGIESGQIPLKLLDAGHELLLRSGTPYWSVLTRARAAMLVFPAAAVFYVYLLGRYLASDKVGCLAAVCFSTDPTLLAHGGVVATDVAAAAGFLAALYHGVRFIARSTLRRALAAGAALALAAACKFSCLLILPALLLILLMRRFSALRKGMPRRYLSAWPKLRHVAALGACGFFVLWATHLFAFSRADAAPKLQREASWQRVPELLRRIPTPMPSFIPGLCIVAEHNRAGHLTYFNGMIDNQGHWAYFLEALAIKSPAALVIGIGVAVIGLVLVGRTPRAWGVVLIPFALYMLISMNAGINIGIRHILPAIPLLYLLVVQQLSRLRLRPVGIGIAVLALIETAWLHPDYLAFFNVLIGGPSNGDKYLLDSNLDWGQDLARAKRWLDENAKGRLVAARTFGNYRLHDWPSDGYTMQHPSEQPAELLVISKNVQRGLYAYMYEDENGTMRFAPDTPRIHRLQPVARIGYSIEIYDLQQR